MPSSDSGRVLEAIAHNIALARRFLADMTFEVFAKDVRSIYAVTRCLEIVSEASRRLPAEMKARHPEVPWDRIAAAGNVYRHDYEDVLADILWNTVKDHLTGLEKAVRDEMTDMTGRNA